MKVRIVAAAIVAAIVAGPVAGQERPLRTPEEWSDWVPNPAEIEVPSISFTVTAEIAEDFQSYFYFHRVETDFETAIFDLRECDDLASARVGLRSPYGLIGSVVNDLIYRPRAQEVMQRASMRRCMSFKGYQRYGLTRELWEQIGFEEGRRREDEGIRQLSLARQAKLASGPKPAMPEIGA